MKIGIISDTGPIEIPGLRRQTNNSDQTSINCKIKEKRGKESRLQYNWSDLIVAIAVFVIAAVVATVAVVSAAIIA